MPGYRGHLLGAWVAYCSLILFLMGFGFVSHVAWIEWALCALLGALFPDVDTGSKGRRLFTPLFALTIALGVLAQKPLLIAAGALLFVMSRVSRHRGLFHSYIFLCALVFFIWYSAGSSFGKHAVYFYDLLFFSVGYCSHLVLDRRRW